MDGFRKNRFIKVIGKFAIKAGIKFINVLYDMDCLFDCFFI